MRQLLALLLVPFTVTGSLLGILYAVITRRHPSPRVLMILGFGGVATLVVAGIAITIFG